MEDLILTVIDKTDVNEPTKREGFVLYELNSFVLQSFNLVHVSYANASKSKVVRVNLGKTDASTYTN